MNSLQPFSGITKMTDDLKERVINSHAVKCGGATDGVKGTYVLLSFKRKSL